jgi:UDP-N-acetylglucosamine--N-acetylmuramyl-(pentapeptide) pyrophosphoryl-undecaprenol N-acetylglucosamine transferase
MTHRILFAGGGTGGHIYPALAVADDLQRRGWEILFLGTRRAAEARIFKKAPFSHVGLPATYLRPSPSGAAAFVSSMGISFAAALRRILAFRPCLCVGLGGYGSFPGVMAARVARVPVALFEPNAVPGKANRFLAAFAEEVWTWFPAAGSGFPNQSKVHATGIPLRPEFRQGPAAPRTAAKVLVLGGSQGASGLNNLVGRMLGALGRFAPKVSFEHVAGPGREAGVARMYRRAGLPAVVRGYVHRMADLYRDVDVVLCRAGAGTLAEITALGLPAVLVPHPTSPDRHQHRNAAFLADRGAAVVIEEDLVNPYEAGQSLGRLLLNETALDRMANASRLLGVPHAHGNVLKRIELLAEV